MNGSKFKYDKNIPAEILPSIQKNLTALEDLVPPWCQVVNVYYVTDGDDSELAGGASASALIDYPYRYGNVKVLPCYFEQDEDERMDTCIHEMVHILTLLVRDYAREEIGRLLTESDHPNYRATVFAGIEERNEAMVCDLTHILQKRLGVGKGV